MELDGQFRLSVLSFSFGLLGWERCIRRIERRCRSAATWNGLITIGLDGAFLILQIILANNIFEEFLLIF